MYDSKLSNVSSLCVDFAYEIKIESLTEPTNDNTQGRQHQSMPDPSGSVVSYHFLLLHSVSQLNNMDEHSVHLLMRSYMSQALYASDI